VKGQTLVGVTISGALDTVAGLRLLIQLVIHGAAELIHDS
jgi:hypothetical protein